MNIIDKIKNHIRAKNAWNNGFPEAHSIDHAIYDWAPYVDTWARWVKQGTHFKAWSCWRVYPSAQKNYQLAWIDHEPFWKALVDYSKNHVFSWWLEITQEAAKNANIIALQHIPINHIGAYFRRVLSGHQTTHPRSVQWAETAGFLKYYSPHLSHWTLDSDYAMSPWVHSYDNPTSDVSHRSVYSMSEWCIAAIECNPLSNEQALHAVGHCMRLAQHCNWTKKTREWKWFEKTVRPFYECTIDWNLLAALHGIALPPEHILYCWSDSLLNIAQYTHRINDENISLLCPDPVLQFLLMDNSFSILNIYQAICRTKMVDSIDTFELPNNAFE